MLAVLIYWHFYLSHLFQFLCIFDGFNNGFYVDVLPHILATTSELCSSLRRQDNVIRSENTVGVFYMASIHLMEVTDALHRPIY
jgi:hypothetical protein